MHDARDKGRARAKTATKRTLASQVPSRVPTGSAEEIASIERMITVLRMMLAESLAVAHKRDRRKIAEQPVVDLADWRRAISS